MSFTTSQWKKSVLCSLAVLLGLAVATSAAAAGTESAEAEILAMDKNGDGVLSVAEHATGARSMFMAMDTNQDSRVTAAEMDAYAAKRTAHEPGENVVPSAQKIKALDTNGDGMLSADEHREGSARMFTLMDANHDGSLDKAELATSHANMLKQSQ